MKRNSIFCAVAGWCLGLQVLAGGVQAQEARISVYAARVENRVPTYLYGSCIEDVNHEIYGGLYDQKLFGESFEEPPPNPNFSGWKTLGGDWQSADNGVSVRSAMGAKLVRAMPELSDGSVETQVRFLDNRGENAGLLVRVGNAAIGADNFDGYEISLMPVAQKVILGKHRQNWTPLAEANVTFNASAWNRLRVQLDGARIRVFVNEAAQPAIDFTDSNAPLLGGQIALRTWNSDATFRNVRFQNSTNNSGANWQDAPFQAVPSVGISRMWDALNVQNGEFLRDSINPYNGAWSQMLHHDGNGVTGVVNRGLNRWGIAINRSQVLAGRLYLRGHDLRGPVTLALQSADGRKTYATQKIAKISNGWTRYPISLSPNASDANARFAIWLDKPGTLWIDQVTLDSGANRFKNLPLRKDIAQKLQQQGLNFLRYGGTMVNAPEYRWKKMIGDPDRRPPYRGHWYPQSTNAFGIEEFLQFCEAAGFEPSFAINVEESAQDAEDLIEYLNGPVTSTWGRRRAQNGHPKPYGVKYIELGNEEVIWADNGNDYDHYVERFLTLHAAMRAKDPNLKFINAAWWRDNSPHMERVFKALDGKADYWDLHPWADNAAAGREVDTLLTDVRAKFLRWNPNTQMKVAILEENGGLHNLQRALGHATILNAVRRHGDFVLTTCPANALQPLGQNDNGWDQGQIFYTPDKVWGMPPYFAQVMASQNHLPLRVASTCEGNSNLDVTATRDENSQTLVLHIVNTGATAASTKLNISGFTNFKSRDHWTLTGALNAINAPDRETIRPQHTTFPATNQLAHSFPAHSYTIVRLKR